jgi:hypothetical protein
VNGVKTKKYQQNKWDGLLPKQLNISILLTQGLHQAEGNKRFLYPVMDFDHEFKANVAEALLQYMEYLP